MIDIAEHTKLVTFVLKRINIIPKGIFDMDDYRQAGMIGLWKAAKNYDPSKGYTFASHAIFHIRSEIHRIRNYEQAEKRQAVVLSMDVPLRKKQGKNTETDLTLENILRDETVSEDAIIENIRLRELIQEAMKYEPFIVSRMVQGYSMNAIGKEMGLSHQRIQQRVKSMRKKLAQ